MQDCLLRPVTLDRLWLQNLAEIDSDRACHSSDQADVIKFDLLTVLELLCAAFLEQINDLLALDFAELNALVMIIRRHFHELVGFEVRVDLCHLPLFA